MRAKEQHQTESRAVGMIAGRAGGSNRRRTRARWVLQHSGNGVRSANMVRLDVKPYAAPIAFARQRCAARRSSRHRMAIAPSG